jgi:hypothetical protein
MPVQVEKQRKIIAILESLSSEKIDEVIDFAEYLRKKSKPVQKVKKKVPSLKVPVFHLGHISKQALDRENLYGEYLDHKLD